MSWTPCFIAGLGTVCEVGVRESVQVSRALSLSE